MTISSLVPRLFNRGFVSEAAIKSLERPGDEARIHLAECLRTMGSAMQLCCASLVYGGITCCKLENYNF